jgi:hypothetical protein
VSEHLRQHALFRRFPIDGSAIVDGQALPTPYHVYDGALLMLGGTAGAGAAAARLGQGLTPLLDTQGRALMALWVGDFTDASLGPHHELQLSLLATTRPLPPVTAHPFAIQRALLTRPEVRMACVALWNDMQRVARYNAEYLGLNAHVAASRVRLERGRWSFHFAESGGTPVAEGEVASAAHTSPAAAWRLLRHIGWQGVGRLLRSPAMHVPVAAPGSRRVAQTWTHGDRHTAGYIGRQDRIAIAHPQYAPLDFIPACVQCFAGLRFVYLRPRLDGGA